MKKDLTKPYDSSKKERCDSELKVMDVLWDEGDVEARHVAERLKGEIGGNFSQGNADADDIGTVLTEIENKGTQLTDKEAGAMRVVSFGWEG